MQVLEPAHEVSLAISKTLLYELQQNMSEYDIPNYFKHPLFYRSARYLYALHLLTSNISKTSAHASQALPTHRLPLSSSRAHMLPQNATPASQSQRMKVSLPILANTHHLVLRSRRATNFPTVCRQPAFGGSNEPRYEAGSERCQGVESVVKVC